ncbi:MAG: hypothetical protein AAB654_15755, partial [Acidobacteriota bacterium]
SKHFIALDTHCSFCEMAVVTELGRMTKRLRCATTIADLREAIESVARPRLTFPTIRGRTDKGV